MANMVMGIAFGTVVTTIKNKTSSGFNGTYHFVDYKDIKNAHPIQSLPIANDRFSIINQENFKKIPGMPIAYWISNNVIDIYESSNKIKDVGFSKKGLDTGKNDKYLRMWFEVEFNKIGEKWYPLNKGGSYRKWYGNQLYVIDWENNGINLKQETNANIRNEKFYFKEGLTWSDLTSGKFGARYFPKGFIFEATGPCYFGNNLYEMLGYMNSKVFNYLAKLTMSTMHYTNGSVANMPYKNVDIDKQIVKENIEISKKEWDSYETSWEFSKSPLLENVFHTIKQAADRYANDMNADVEKLIQNEYIIDKFFIEKFNLSNELRNELEVSDSTLRTISKSDTIVSFVHYAVGVILGRYSLDAEKIVFAGGKWDPSNYVKFQPDADNVLLITDDEYFKDGQYDIVNRFVDFVEITFGKETLEENLQFIADTLGGKGTSREIIRRYFVKDFYKDHLKTYSNRPIYWQLDSGKQNGFKALMYLHRYTPDQLGKVRTDYLHELQKAYDNRIELRQQQISTSDNPKEINLMTKEIAKIQKQLKEVREYDEKLGHLALKRIELDLDDGVIVNYDKLQRDPETGEKFAILSKGVKEPKK